MRPDTKARIAEGIRRAANLSDAEKDRELAALDKETTTPLAVALARVEALKAALGEALQLAANAHAQLKSPRMGGEQVPLAMRELEKRTALYRVLEGEP